MNDNYPFDKIGRKMPYTMPEDFFSQMQANVLAEVAKEESGKRKAERQISVKLVSERQTSVKSRKAMLKRICLVAASIAACVCLVVGFGYSVLSSDGENKSSGAFPANVASVNASSANEHSVDKAYDNLTSEEQQPNDGNKPGDAQRKRPNMEQLTKMQASCISITRWSFFARKTTSKLRWYV